MENEINKITSMDEIINDMTIDECIDSIISELDTPIERRRHNEVFNKLVAKVAEVRTRDCKRKMDDFKMSILFGEE